MRETKTVWIYRDKPLPRIEKDNYIEDHNSYVVIVLVAILVLTLSLIDAFSRGL